MKPCALFSPLACAANSLHAEGKITTEFGDSTKPHVFTLKANLLTRGEWKQGELHILGLNGLQTYIMETLSHLDFK